jgi:hypothetical protein
MLVRLAVIALLAIVLWLVTKRRQSMFRAPKTADWFNKRINEWKEALKVISSATSKDDAIAKIKAARDSKPAKSFAHSIYSRALREAENPKVQQVPQIVENYSKIISRHEKDKMRWVNTFITSKRTQRLAFNEQIADAKKYGNVNDFVAAYQKKVTDLMAKKTTSTFQGEENIPDDMRVQMYQTAISDMQKAGTVDAFIKTRQSIMDKAKSAARRARAKMQMKQSGGNFYFYFNSVK